MKINVYSQSPVEIERKLSNFYPWAFTFDGVKCASMEGFLQSLKFKDPAKQLRVCLLTGFEAKRAGRDQHLKNFDTLWWKGEEIDRHSSTYENFLLFAYLAMVEQNMGLQNILNALPDDVEISHSIGTKDKTRTILSEEEFCIMLYACRLHSISLLPSP